MIGSLEIKNFKCFESASFTMRPLTVLTGINGGGKSTVLQSLLLARTTATTQGQTVRLNGPLGLALGESRDVLHWAASGDRIVVGLNDPDGGSSWQCQFSLPEDEHALHLNTEWTPAPSALGLGRPGAGFTYLCAERLGPRDTLAVSAEEPDEIGVGVQGEFTAQVLALRETRAVQSRSRVREALHHPGADSPLPRLQAEAWASDIVRPIRITAQMAAGIMASTVRFTEAAYGNEQVRPVNTGFGVSYALPIIVAGLLTEPGDILLVENPEAHLHPAGQSKLGRFLARVAGSGVQVVVETHSDHVLNGARLAVAQDRVLAAPDMIIHYFGHDRPLEVRINDRGELSHWPEGFFDQIDNDLGGLARARRAR
ncbi:AAA family ATPase [Streptomyces jumonjinensis]|uniref:AAA family ATPase n=1 Tax=Streptomyces jumonjinensis TaxID=1945 RepID=UPI0037A5AA27